MDDEPQVLRFALSSIDPISQLLTEIAPAFFIDDEEEDNSYTGGVDPESWFFVEGPAAALALQPTPLVVLSPNDERAIPVIDRPDVSSRLRSRFQALRPRFRAQSPPDDGSGSATSAAVKQAGDDGDNDDDDDDVTLLTSQDIEELERAHHDLTVEEQHLVSFSAVRPSFAERVPFLRLYPQPLWPMAALDDLWLSMWGQYAYLSVWGMLLVATFFGAPSSTAMAVVMVGKHSQDVFDSGLMS